MLEIKQETKNCTFWLESGQEILKRASQCFKETIAECQRLCNIRKYCLCNTDDTFRLLRKRWVEEFGAGSRFILFLLIFCSHFLWGAYTSCILNPKRLKTGVFLKRYCALTGSAACFYDALSCLQCSAILEETPGPLLASPCLAF